MIPLLLWRCPLCATNDALVHVARRLRPDRVVCRQCGAAWHVRRVPGDNFYLRLVAPGISPAAGTGDERSVTAWYDVLKQTLALVPLDGSGLPLQPGENLYLASGAVELQAEASDPLFFPDAAPGRDLHADKREVAGAVVGKGRLFLTSQRLLWQGEDGRACDFPLQRLNSAHAVMDLGLALMVELRLYTIRFLEESLLKWVTYVALVAPRVQAETGHRIVTSHF